MRCPVSTCAYETSNDVGEDNEVAVTAHLEMLKLHCTYAHSEPTSTATVPGEPSRTARIQQPKIVLTDGSVEAEDWEFFLHSWSEYKSLSAPGSRVKEILGNVLGEVAAGVFNRLGKDAYAALTENDLLQHAKKLVVRERNCLINRLKLSSMTQDEDEQIHKFETRLQPVARTGLLRKLALNASRRWTLQSRWCVII